MKAKVVSTVQHNGIIRDFDLKQWPIRILYGVVLAIGIVVVIVSAFPVVWVSLQGFKDIREYMSQTEIMPSTFNFANYAKTWDDLNFMQYYRNSFLSIIGSVICAVFFNGLLGYALSKIKPRGSKVVYALVMWGMLIPATTSVVPLFVNISKIGLTGSFIPLWLGIGANAFYVILFKNFFDSLPMSLIEAAKIDGATDFSIFRKIAVPMSQAIIMVVIMYAINAAWSDFLLPYLILKGSDWETVMVRIFQFRTSRANIVEVLRSVVFAIIPPIVLFAIFQKQITQVTLQSGIKG
jgi:multiple sugar transport system permease protein